MAYDKQEQKDVERIYDPYAKNQAFERVPYVLANAVKSVVAQAAAEQATRCAPSTSRSSSTTASWIGS